MRMMDLRERWVGFAPGTAACGVCRYWANRSIEAPALGGFVQIVSCRSSCGRCDGETYICDIDAQRPDVRPREVLHHGLIIDCVARNKDDKAPPLKIQGKRPRQRQIRRSGNDDDLEAGPIPRPPRPSRLPGKPAPLVTPIHHDAGREDGQARQDLVLGGPVLRPVVQRARAGRRRRRWSAARADQVGQPILCRERIAGVVCDDFGVALDHVGDLARVTLDFVRDR